PRWARSCRSSPAWPARARRPGPAPRSTSPPCGPGRRRPPAPPRAPPRAGPSARGRGGSPSRDEPSGPDRHPRNRTRDLCAFSCAIRTQTRTDLVAGQTRGMHAVTIVDGQLEWREHPDPTPGTGEVLVDVRAAGLNGADRLQLAGRYPAPPGAPADIPGLELAGEVVALGPGATRFAVGDRVMAVVAGGGQAEQAVVHERHLLTVPDGLG